MDFEKALFDEYKRLDAICRDMFSSVQGVSEYIRQMEQIPSHRRYKVPMWEEDYRTLKHLRWLRNKIAHDTSATDCGPDDIAQLEDFYDRILHSEDPLASLRKIEQASQVRMPRVYDNIREDVPCSNNYYKPEKRHRVTSQVLVAAACILIIVFLSVVFLKVPV